MKILILINSFRLGGAEKLCYDLALSLYKNKEFEIYLCSMGSVSTELEKSIFHALTQKGIKCLSVNKPIKAGRMKCVLSIRKIIRDYSIDVIHTNGQSPDFYGRIARILSNVKVITTIHNTNGYSKNVEKVLSNFTSMYTAVSKETYEYALNTLGITNNISVIENGIDTEMYSSIIHFESPVLLTVGRLVEQKGYIETANQIAPYIKRHPEVIWKIYGDYEESPEYCKRFIEVTKKLGIHGQTKLMGVSTNPEEIYKEGFCFVLGSTYEGFGIAFVEAMLVGLPVIARNVGCLRDISKLGGFYYDMDNINVSDTLDELQKQDVFKEKYQQKNRDIIISKYSIDNIARQYGKVYSTTMGKRK